MAAPNRAGAALLAAHFGGMNGRTESENVNRNNGQNKLRETSVSGAPNAMPLTTGHIAPSQPLPMSADSNTLMKGATATGRPKRQFDVLRDDVPEEIGDNVHKKRKLAPPSARRPTGNAGEVGHGTACPIPTDTAGGVKSAFVKTPAKDTNVARNRLLNEFKGAASHAGLPDSENALEILKNVLKSYDVPVKAYTSSLSHGTAQTVVSGDVADQDLPSSVMEPRKEDLVTQFCDNPSDGSPSSQTNESGDEQNLTDVPVDQDDTATVNGGLLGENGVTAAVPNDTTGVEKTDNTDEGPATTATTDSDVINKEPNVLNQAQVAPVPSHATVELSLTVPTQVPALCTPDITAHDASQLGADVQEPVEEPSRYGLPRNFTDSFYCPEDVLEQALGVLNDFQTDDEEPTGNPSFNEPPRNLQDSVDCPDDDLEEIGRVSSTEFQPDAQEPTGQPSFYEPQRNLHDTFYSPEQFLPEGLQGASTAPQVNHQEPMGRPSYYGPPRNLHDGFYCPEELLPEALQGASMESRVNSREPTGQPSFYGRPWNLHDEFNRPKERLPEELQAAPMEPEVDVQERTGKPSFYGPPRNIYDSFYCPDDVLQEVLQNQTPEQPSVGNSLLTTRPFLAPGNRLSLTPLVVNGAVQRPRSSLLTSLGPAESTTSATNGFEAATTGPFSQATPVVTNSVALHHLPRLATYGDPDLCIPHPDNVDPRYPARLRNQISERRMQSLLGMERLHIKTFHKGQLRGYSLEHMVEYHKKKGRKHVRRFRRIEQLIIEDYRRSLHPQANQKVQRTGGSPTASTLGKRVRFTDPEVDDVQFLESPPAKRPRTTDDMEPPKTPRSILKPPHQRKDSDWAPDSGNDGGSPVRQPRGS